MFEIMVYIYFGGMLVFMIIVLSLIVVMIFRILKDY